jgi:hypothetical protein
MSLQSIPEDLLYELLPSAILEMDQRGLLQAVVGGYQDRIEDLRSFVKRYEVFLDPLETTPEGASNSLLVKLNGPYGNVIQRSVEIDSTTPQAIEISDLNEWVAGKLGVEVETVISATYASDSFRHIDTNLLEYLASTIGAVVYKTDTTVDSVERQRQIVESYFPRLRAKGTAISFDILGRLLGFDDVIMTPLWGRVTPRLPNDIGHPVNDPDFASEAEYYPDVRASIFYDPNKLDDGPFYRWSSQSLVTDPQDPNFYTSINGLNPFVVVKLTGTGTIPTHPEPGTYLLSGGGPHTKATTNITGSGLVFEALAEGESFNNLSVVVSATGPDGDERTLSILDRLSAVKYRTSFFNLGLFDDLETAQTVPVQRNKDLQANPTIATGTAISPYYPWSSGTQVGANEVQLNVEALVKLGVQAGGHFDEVRAATRSPRVISVGYTSFEEARYAAYTGRASMFVVGAPTTYEGSIAFPRPTYDNEVAVQTAFVQRVTRDPSVSNRVTVTLQQIPERGTVEVYRLRTTGVTRVVAGMDDGVGHLSPADTVTLERGFIDYARKTVTFDVKSTDTAFEIQYLALVRLSAERHATDPNVVNFKGTSVTGRYNFVSGSFSFNDTIAALPNGRTFVSAFTTTSTEVIRPEPPGSELPVTGLGPEQSPGGIWSVTPLIAFTLGSGRYRYTLTSNETELRTLTTDQTDFSTRGPGSGEFIMHGDASVNVLGIAGRPISFSIREIITATPAKPSIASYQARPEDEPFFIVRTGSGTVHHQLHDEYAWRRSIIAGGELVDKNFYQPPLEDAITHSVESKMVVLDHHGVEKSIIGYDDFNRAALVIPSDPDVNDYVSRIQRVGGYLSPKSKQAVYNFVVSVKKANLWSKINEIGTFTGKDLKSALVKLKYQPTRSSNLVNSNFVDGDYKETGADLSGVRGKLGAHIDTDFPAGLLTGTDHHLAFFSGNDFIYDFNAYQVIGAVSNFPLSGVGIAKSNLGSPPFPVGIAYFGFDVFSSVFLPNIKTGFYFGQRSGGLQSLYRNGVLGDSVSTIINLVPNFPIFLLATNLDGARYQEAVGTQFQFYSLGRAFTSAEVAIYSRLVAQLQEEIGRGGINTRPIKMTFVDRETDASLYQAGQPALAIGSGTNVYHAGLVQDVLVADPVSFNHPAHRDDLVGWLSFTEHPDDDLIVADHSPTGSEQVLSGVEAQDRVLDGTRGWHLKLRNGISVTSANNRGCTTQASLSFFIKAYDVGIKSDPMTIFSFGPISFDLSPDGTQLSAYALNKDNVRVINSTFTLIPGFNQVTARVSGNVFIHGVNGVESTTQSSTYKDFTDATLTIEGKDATFGIHDLRIWNVLKTTADTSRIANRILSQVAVKYSQSCFLTAGLKEQWGLRALPSGFVVPVAVENIRAPNEMLVQRYGVDGRYIGDVRFKEVGLGGGQLVPGAWKLGNRFYAMPATGRTVVSTSEGQLPGINSISGSSGTLLANANPIRERAWIKGDDTRVYELIVDNFGNGPEIVSTPVYQDRELLEYQTAGSLQHMHQPTGAEVKITAADGTTLMSVRQHSSGTYQVYQGTNAATGVQPPVFFYNQSQVIVSQTGTLNWDSRNDFGSNLGIPARDNPGVISFLNQGTLSPGPHRLDVNARVIGNPGQNFPGFDVEVSVGQDVVPMTLAEGATIQDPSQTNSLEFDVTSSLVGRFAVEFNWLNNLDIPAQGIFRDLGIDGYTLRRLSPKVYKVVTAAGSLQPVNVDIIPGTISPGGWLATISSTGTVDAWLHESKDSTRPQNDSFQSKVPLSDLLTVNTDAKREDIIVLSQTGSITAPDLSPPPAPNATVSRSIADAVTTRWMWSGAVTPTSVNIRARVSGEGYVRAIVSKSPNFTSPIYSNPVYAADVFLNSTVGRTNNVVSLDVVGLEANTTYYYAVGGIAGADFNKTGTFKTWPSGQASFSFAMSGAAATGSTSQVFDTIKSQDPLFFLHTGDLHQASINVAFSGTQYQDAFESVMGSSRQAEMYRAMPVVYAWDEKDFGSTHSDKISSGKPSAQAVYRQTVPHYQLVASGTIVPGNPASHYVNAGIGKKMVTGPIYHSFTIGRTYFIVSDLRSVKDSISDSDTASKSMMGATQKSWFKRQLLDANGKYPLIVWVSPVPWIGDGSVTCDDGWCKFPNERAEIANFIKDNAIQGLVVVSGNMHALAADDGTNSDYATGGGAGIPVLHAGALDASGSTKGGPYSEGTPIQGSGQFAIVTVTDSGADITVAYSGRDINNVEKINLTFNAKTSPN